MEITTTALIVAIFGIGGYMIGSFQKEEKKKQ